MMKQYNETIAKNQAVISDFFSFSIENIEFKIVKNRKEFDKEASNRSNKKIKTPRWVVGKTIKKTIILLDKDAYDKESSHKSEDFEMVMRHEIAHIYLRTFLIHNNQMIWFEEAFAHFISNISSKEYWKLNEKKTIPDLPSIIYPEQMNNIHSSYIFGSKFIHWLYSVNGKNKIIEFLEQLREKPKTDPCTIFRNVFSEEMSDSFKRWKYETIPQNKNNNR
ncbi:MAG: hypothetical protein ACQESC_04760 [Nanobdellota archaeon]